MSLAIVTANRLADGRVIYLGERGWSTQMGDSKIAGSDAEATALLELAQRAVADRVVVDPYLIDVLEEAGSIRPARRRERIRGAGPTVRPDLGYQAGEEA